MTQPPECGVREVVEEDIPWRRLVEWVLLLILIATGCIVATQTAGSPHHYHWTGASAIQ